MQSSLAQNINIKFNLVEGNDGEPLGQINSITQDPNGYMWFSGTQKGCIYRYDGIRMIRFKHDSLNENSLGGRRTETVYADSTGMIWIGFYEGGLDQYNPGTGIFTHYRINPKDPGCLSEGMVSAILRDHQGRLWVGTQNGLDRLDEKTGHFIHYKNEPGNPASLSNNYVRAIYEDRQGVLWIGTGFEYDVSNSNEGGLNRLEPNGGFTRFMQDPKNPNSLINNRVRAICEDSRGVFWIGTAGKDGLYTMDREKGSFTRYEYDPAKPDQLSRPPLNKDFDPITFIREDGSGAIWIGTNTSGMNRFDPITKRIIHFESGNGYPDRGCFTAYTSRDGVLWLGSYEETPFLYRVDPSVTMIDNTVTGSIVNSILDDGHGFLWLGTNQKGLQQYDLNKNLVHQFNYDQTDSISLSDIFIYGIFQFQPDTLWLTTSRGIIIFNKKTGQFSRLHYKSKPDSPPEKFIVQQTFQVIQDKDDLKWFATSQGLFSYKTADLTLKQYVPDVNDPGSISSTLVNHLLEDEYGNIWISTALEKAGIDRLNKETGRFSHYLQEISATTLYEDSKKTLWAGTIRGLYKYDREADVFSPFFEAQSELSTTAINNMVEDDLKNLWILTESSIVKLNADRKNYFIYGKKYGIRSGSLLYAGICKTADGKILFGNPTGVYTFSPNDVELKSEPTKIIVTNFLINNQPVFSGGGSPLRVPIEETSEIQLKYKQNILSFRYAAMDYRAPEANKYYSMLENFDDTWRQSSGDNIATYINVPPGKYVFRVKSFNIDGIKSEKAIRILIDPPWWKTWWAYGIYGALILTVMIGLYRLQKQRTIRIERQKAQVKELAQAREIEKAYTALKLTQAQLVHSEKMASLGELTAGIAHEIQNPLNFMNNFSDVNKELIEEMKQELVLGNIDGATTIANSIQQNEDRINRHGQRADAIVKGMLQHSRKSAGQKEPTDINALADEYLRLSYQGFRAKDKFFNATIKTEFDKNIAKINIIPQDIGRVLLNLYNNAFYALMEKKKQQADGFEPFISVETKKVNGMTEIRVKDNGNGIPQKLAGKIFQPFFTTKPTGQGTGLGLSLSYDIIKAHGGEIKVESTEGLGIEFIVQIPIE